MSRMEAGGSRAELTGLVGIPRAHDVSSLLPYLLWCVDSELRSTHDCPVACDVKIYQEKSKIVEARPAHRITKGRRPRLVRIK